MGRASRGLKVEQPLLAQGLDDHAHIAPAGVLGQNRAEHDLEGGFAGPPVLGAEMVEQTGMDFFNPVDSRLLRLRKKSVAHEEEIHGNGDGPDEHPGHGQDLADLERPIHHQTLHVTAPAEEPEAEA